MLLASRKGLGMYKIEIMPVQFQCYSVRSSKTIICAKEKTWENIWISIHFYPALSDILKIMLSLTYFSFFYSGWPFLEWLMLCSPYPFGCLGTFFFGLSSISKEPTWISLYIPWELMLEMSKKVLAFSNWPIAVLSCSSPPKLPIAQKRIFCQPQDSAGRIGIIGRLITSCVQVGSRLRYSLSFVQRLKHGDGWSCRSFVTCLEMAGLVGHLLLVENWDKSRKNELLPVISSQSLSSRHLHLSASCTPNLVLAQLNSLSLPFLRIGYCICIFSLG